MPSINIPVNDSPLSTLQSQAKDAAKEVAKLQKSIDKARKDGTQVADDVIKKLGAAEQRQKSLQEKIKTDGARMRYAERAGQQASQNVADFNVRGMAFGQFNSALDAMGQKPGALNSVLKNSLFNRVTGGAGAEAAAGAGSVRAALGEFTAAYAAPVGIAIGIAKAFQEGMSIFHNYSDDLRKSRADFAVNMADSRNTGSGRELDNLRMKGEEMRNDKFGRAASGYLGYLPGVAAIDFLRNRSAGVDAYSMAGKERAQAARDSGFALNANRAGRIAEDRSYADAYGSEELGFVAQNTIGKIKNLWGSNSDAAEATAKVKESFARFAKFANTGDEAAMRGDFSSASENYKQAAAEQEMKSNWRDPLSVWSGNQESIKAAKMFALSQNPLPPLRRGQ